jgi:uncharacterized protein (DUF983 family)
LKVNSEEISMEQNKCIKCRCGDLVDGFIINKESCEICKSYTFKVNSKVNSDGRDKNLNGNVKKGLEN